MAKRKAGNNDMMKSHIYEIIQIFSGHNNILTVPRIFIDYTGSINAAMFLNQLIYWTDRSTNNGWIYKTYNEWSEEIGLSKSTIQRIIKFLNKDKQIIETKIKKAEGFPTVHYRILQEAFTEDFIDFLERSRSSQNESNDRIKMNQTIESKRLDAYTETLTETTDIEDNSYELSKAFSSKNARPKKRKRKQKPKTSMKDKTKQKAQNKAPKKKQQNKVTYENIPNTQLLQIWNQQSNLRKHHNKASNVYKQLLRKLEMLRKGTLHKIVSEDMLQSDVPYEWFSTPWKKREISKAIKILNEWCKEGNYPQKKDWIKRLSLSDAVFNTRSGSPLMQAYKQGVRKLFDPHSMLNNDEEKKAYDYFATFFSDVLKKHDVKTQRQIVDLVLDLKGKREEYKANWARYEPEYFDYGVPPASLQYLALDYVDFLRGKYPTEFEPNKSLTPRGLKIGSYVWDKFSKAYDHRFGADVITGPR